MTLMMRDGTWAFSLIFGMYNDASRIWNSANRSFPMDGSGSHCLHFPVYTKGPRSNFSVSILKAVFFPGF